MDANGTKWIPMDPNESQWIPMYPSGSQWILMAPNKSKLTVNLYLPSLSDVLVDLEGMAM